MPTRAQSSDVPLTLTARFSRRFVFLATYIYATSGRLADCIPGRKISRLLRSLPNHLRSATTRCLRDCIFQLITSEGERPFLFSTVPIREATLFDFKIDRLACFVHR